MAPPLMFSLANNPLVHMHGTAVIEKKWRGSLSICAGGREKSKPSKSREKGTVPSSSENVMLVILS